MKTDKKHRFVLWGALGVWMLPCLGLVCGTQIHGSVPVGRTRIVLVLDPPSTTLSALASALVGASRRNVDPSPELLLALTPMLRKGPPTDLLILSAANRKCIGDRLQHVGPAELWAIEPHVDGRQPWPGAHRMIRGSTRNVLHQLRSLCYSHPPTVVLADRANCQQALLGCLLATARAAPLYLVDRTQPVPSQVDTDALAARRVECIGRDEDWKTLRLAERGERT